MLVLVLQRFLKSAHYCSNTSNSVAGIISRAGKPRFWGKVCRFL